MRVTRANAEHLRLARAGSEAIHRWKVKNPSRTLQLDGAELEGVVLLGAELSGANLRGANLQDAQLTLAELRGADLREAQLNGAELNGADLSGADLRRADLRRADLNRVELHDAKLARCKCGWNLFGDVDLSRATGLDTVRHYGPGVVSVGTLFLSRYRIPETFLQQAGVPVELIRFLRSRTGTRVKRASCFISYSSRQETLARQLYQDLVGRGVTCWFAPEGLRIGDHVRTRLDEMIWKHDKVLLILSKEAICSQWVEQEVETAFARERRESANILFPIRVDDSVLRTESGWAAMIKNTRYIGDFRGWRRAAEYRVALERLFQHLALTAATRVSTAARGTRRG